MGPAGGRQARQPRHTKCSEHAAGGARPPALCLSDTGEYLLSLSDTGQCLLFLSLTQVECLLSDTGRVSTLSLSDACRVSTLSL